MPMDMVARARSMDGSADVIWRRTGRSLSGFKETRTGRNIVYDHATSRTSVRTPKYTFDGFGLEITANLLGTVGEWP
ncbi:Uncharacterized protein FKW44_025279 [Caligus rogercresseyi]|uniref:Uncharacterized protein n=1 Tax=Caligus rogercresseyi TaxID=217165 RepID=A0A7T8GKA7_CALRO|nr:Uncharacterized protein FKW44_025279 [Caligus rogercresseyi]